MIKARLIHWRNKYWGKPKKKHVQKPVDWDALEKQLGPIKNRPKSNQTQKL